MDHATDARKAPAGGPPAGYDPLHGSRGFPPPDADDGYPALVAGTSGDADAARALGRHGGFPRPEDDGPIVGHPMAVAPAGGDWHPDDRVTLGPAGGFDDTDAALDVDALEADREAAMEAALEEALDGLVVGVAATVLAARSRWRLRTLLAGVVGLAVGLAI